MNVGACGVAQLPLCKSDRGAVIDFRHLISHLLRKPGAFANYRWREELFPTPVYRAAYNHLERTAPFEADRRYLEYPRWQTPVENALGYLLDGATSDVQRRVGARRARHLERQYPLTSMAAVGRLVHHSIILEFDGVSRRVAETSAKPKRHSMALPGSVKSWQLPRRSRRRPSAGRAPGTHHAERRRGKFGRSFLRSVTR
jgi:hypothetical protein